MRAMERFAIAAMIVVFMTAYGVAENTGGKVALIADVKGSVLVKKKGAEWEKAFLTQLLNKGDMIKVSRGAYVVVQYFSSNKKETMPGFAVIEVGEKGGDVKQGEKKRLTIVTIRSALAIPATVKDLTSYKPLGVVGKVYGENAMVLLSPGPGTTEYRPDFSWTRIDAADSYHFKLFHRGNAPLIDESFRGNSLKFPPAVPSLKAGVTYNYRIDALEGGVCTQFCDGEIKVLSPEELKEVETAAADFREALKKNSEDVTAYTSMILIYLDHSLHYEALDLCKKLSALRPDDEGLHLWLKEFYNRMGRKEEADKESLILKKLEKK